MIIIIAEDQLFLLTQCSAERILLMTNKTTSFQFFVCSHHCFAFILPAFDFKFKDANQQSEYRMIASCLQTENHAYCLQYAIRGSATKETARIQNCVSHCLRAYSCYSFILFDVACTRFHTQSYACAGFGLNFNVTRISVEIDAVIIQLDPCAIRY